MLLHPYGGIRHDAVLYSLFALARLHPDTLTADIFLRFGSQDSFSLFTPIYAAVMSVLGMEHAAQLLVFLFQAALLGCAWLLARRFMPLLDATLSIALLLVLPDEYGMGDTFHFLEDFITARLPAEALVLGAVLAATTQRYWIAAGCVIAAMLIHPIMGASGAAFLVITFLVPRRPRLTLAIMGGGFTAAVGILVAIAPLGRVQDVDWLFAIHSSSSYLFISMWTLFDWTRAAIYLALLTIGWRIGATPGLRQVCVGLLATVACGALISLVFCDLLHVSLFIDVQAWRWFWLADILAITLAPAILRSCWQRGYAGRIAVLTLGSAWVFRNLPPDLLLITAAVACALLPTKSGQHRYWRLALLGACALTGVAICLNISNAFDYVPEITSNTSELVEKARGACANGVIPAMLLIASWLALRHSTFTATTAKVAATAVWTTALTAVLICGWLLPFTWVNYSDAYYTPQTASRFAPWRAMIPSRAEVMWVENPVATWTLLDRPTYTSGPQVAGAIFSREKALLVQRRGAQLAAALMASGLLTKNGLQPATDTTMRPLKVMPLSLEGMRTLCSDPDLGYLVNWQAPTPTPFPPITLDPTKAHGTVYLYRCADLRS